MKHRTTPALLAVVALLLALNLAAALPWSTAQAQDEVQLWLPPVPRIIQISSVGYHTGSRHENKLYRLWSDGMIEWTKQGCSDFPPGNWCPWQVVSDP